MQTKHTAGDWLINTTALEPNAEILITDTDGRGICRMPKEVKASELIKGKSKKETLANAALIAAAPELLQACNAARLDIIEGRTDELTLAVLEAVINKALGYKNNG